jgi:uncharacterized membrane protein
MSLPEQPARSSNRPAVTVAIGVLASAVTVSFYALGSGRAYDYDSSESVGSFIATRSLLDPFRRQLQFNNHPLFSFIDHIVYTLGGHSEAALRAFPITVAALTVGIVGYWAADRWGPSAGLIAAALLATNPTFAVLSRSVRGYSLLTFSAVVSTLLLGRVLEDDRRRLMIAYGAMVAIGIATHLYALVFLAGQIAIVAAMRRLDHAWFATWLGALVLGLAAYLGIARRMLTSGAHEQGVFQPWFPARAADALLGSSPLAIALLAALTLSVVVRVRRREIVIGLGTIATALAIVWISSPRDLYPRFLVWLIPGVTLIIASSVPRSRLIPVLAGIAVVAMIRVDARYWTANPVPSLQAAQIVRDARRDGDQPCVLPDIRGALIGYTAAAREVSNPNGLSHCGIVLGGGFDQHHLRATARQTFRYRWILPAETPYIVYSREPPLRRRDGSLDPGR